MEAGSAVFDLDVLACPRCGGRLRLIATVEDPAVVGKILAPLGLLPSHQQSVPFSTLDSAPEGRSLIARRAPAPECLAWRGIDDAVRVALSAPGTPSPGPAGPGPV